MESQGGGEGPSSSSFQSFQHEEQQQILLQHPQEQQQQQQHIGVVGSCGGGGTDQGFIFPSEGAAAAPMLHPWSLPQVHHSIHPLQFSMNNNSSSGHHDRFYPPSLPPLPPPPLYGDLYARRASAALQFAYDVGGVGSSSHDPLGLAGLCIGSEGFLRGGGVSSSSPFGGLHAEFSKMSAQEIMDAKALAASKSHSEAERRRRERINAHLAKLRSLLPSTTKTDKASLLAEVIQHVKELKRQTLEIAEESPLPTEADELTVDAANDEDGRFVVRASLCCEDRSDLLPDLIKALKALRLRTLKAEITTLGGRVKNVLVITGENDSDNHQQQQSITTIQDALKAVMERAAADEPSSTTGSGIKRQRTTSLSSILEHRSI